MCAMIREYFERTGLRGRLQAGRRHPRGQARARLPLPDEGGAGRPLAAPDLFRFGASALLTDIERQLEHFVTGRYSAAHRHPMV
jgi:deoxyribose-phosphate aldolase